MISASALASVVILSRSKSEMSTTFTFVRDELFVLDFLALSQIMHSLQIRGVSTENDSCAEINGVYMIKHPVCDKGLDIRKVGPQRLSELHRWTPELNSYLVAAYVKSGTHYIWDVMMMMINGNTEVPTYYKEELFIEMNTIPKLQSASKPSVYNTHMEPESIPKDVSNLKTVIMLRNPRDIMVSAYHHNHIRMFCETWDEFFSDWMEIAQSGDEAKDSWWEYMRQVWRMRNRPNVHIIHYENLLMNFKEEIRKLATFMSVDITDELIGDIQTATKIETIRKVRETISSAEDNLYFLPLYRKGIIGEWKDYFTTDQIERFDKATQLLLDDCKGLSFIYEYSTNS